VFIIVHTGLTPLLLLLLFFSSIRSLISFWTCNRESKTIAWYVYIW